MASAQTLSWSLASIKSFAPLSATTPAPTLLTFTSILPLVKGYFYQNCVKHKEQMLVDGCRRSVALDSLHQDRTNPPCKFGSTRTN
ncbi:hypothetical protein Pyn_11776 [Prunus yedoensis var. nudiflora]|uniref:Uncharacterized protein n=1 Tax=Prunus yedoensis var. nudiflora TaxID=2094558 RepID=A0A314XN42_PRUYE|nr:hypothetical protein Pyn_11776 [Prunus yedoensis var. nudiflora]